MKILMVNKFLHPAGGAETYVFQLGAFLQKAGHEVQYFGMEHPDRCVSNRLGLYTSTVDFHSGKLLEQSLYPFRILYSREAKQKLTAVLEDFQPDVMHLNNFNYQLTPSILVAAEEYRKRHGKLRVVLTAHDYQLVCPNHMLYRPVSSSICQQCLDGHYHHCISGRCIHGSLPRSVLGAMESFFWHRSGIYSTLDSIICPSDFLRQKLDCDPVLVERTVTLHNFTTARPVHSVQKEDYVLFFGRYSEEKGIRLLLEVCRSLPEIPFVFAGDGPLEAELTLLPNVTDLGFLQGEHFLDTIRKAQFSVCPSVWFEPFGLSAIESIQLGTPLIWSDDGGLDEICSGSGCGLSFPHGSKEGLRDAILTLWNDREHLAECQAACKEYKITTLENYVNALMKQYQFTGEQHES